jgi:transposase
MVDVSMVMAENKRPLVPPTEVQPKAKRRTFTLAYKRKVVREADGCKATGSIGRLLRREGLNTTHLHEWREARERGELQELASRKRGPKPAKVDSRDQKIEQLEKENARLRLRAERAEGLVALQKKVADLLETSFPEPKGKR